MDKTAFGYVKKYMEGKNIDGRKYEVSIRNIVGVKRTSGQHRRNYDSSNDKDLPFYSVNILRMILSPEL